LKFRDLGERSLYLLEVLKRSKWGALRVKKNDEKLGKKTFNFLKKR